MAAGATVGAAMIGSGAGDGADARCGTSGVAVCNLESPPVRVGVRSTNQASIAASAAIAATAAPIAGQGIAGRVTEGGAGGCGGGIVRAGNRPLAPLVPSRLRQADSTNNFTRCAETGLWTKR